MIFAKDLPIDSEFPESCVYWIHLKDEHTDPRVSGYVGVCRQGWEKRFKEHLYHSSVGSRLHVHRAMAKYADRISVKVLAVADPEFCLLLEALLRPTAKMMGTWNISPGGATTTFGLRHTEELKEKLSKDRLGSGNPFHGKTHSDEWRAMMSLIYKGVKKGKMPTRKPWTSAQATENSLDFWKQSQHYFDMWEIEGNPKFGIFAALAGKSKVPNKPLRTMVDRFIGGWNPSEDSSYLAWLSEYKLKEATNA